MFRNNPCRGVGQSVATNAAKPSPEKVFGQNFPENVSGKIFRGKISGQANHHSPGEISLEKSPDTLAASDGFHHLGRRGSHPLPGAVHMPNGHFRRNFRGRRFSPGVEAISRRTPQKRCKIARKLLQKCTKIYAKMRKKICQNAQNFMQNRTKKCMNFRAYSMWVCCVNLCRFFPEKCTIFCEGGMQIGPANCAEFFQKNIHIFRRNICIFVQIVCKFVWKNVQVLTRGACTPLQQKCADFSGEMRNGADLSF